MAGGIAPPRNVIYVDRKNSEIPLAGIANLPYTDVIFSFLYPDENFNLRLAGPVFDDNLAINIQTLQNAGKNVLISFGGALNTKDPDDLLAQAYLYWGGQGGNNISGLVTQIVNVVVQYGFDGLDIDYEDNRGFMGTYDGVAFLSQLTSGLYNQLPARIITHAPQVAYWDGSGDEFQWATNPIAPYAKLWQQVGNYITWFNNQFYNTRRYDENAATKVEWYSSIVALTGDIEPGPPIADPATSGPQRLLMGVLLSAEGGGEGVESLPDMVQNVITPLQQEYPPNPAFPGVQFGGVMAWQFAFDQDGTWASGIWQALAGPASTPLPLPPTSVLGKTAPGTSTT
jgi:hypothetical protein